MFWPSRQAAKFSLFQPTGSVPSVLQSAAGRFSFQRRLVLLSSARLTAGCGAYLMCISFLDIRKGLLNRHMPTYASEGQEAPWEDAPGCSLVQAQGPVWFSFRHISGSPDHNFILSLTLEGEKADFYLSYLFFPPHSVVILRSTIFEIAASVKFVVDPEMWQGGF